MLIVMALTLEGCGFLLPPLWNAGADPQGAHLKAEAGSVVAALQRFERDKGHLPSKPDELVPSYLDALPLDLRMHYRPTDGSLTFSYELPFPDKGVMVCRTNVAEPKWTCDGYI